MSPIDSPFEKLFLDTFKSVKSYETGDIFSEEDIELLDIQTMHSLAGLFMLTLAEEIDTLKKK